MRANVFLRVAGPTILVSGVLLSACSATAVILHRQQIETAAIFSENVRSRAAAHDLETELRELLGLLRASPDAARIEQLHQRVSDSLNAARNLANNEVERSALSEVESAFEQHMRLWRSVGDSGDPPTAEVFNSVVEPIRDEAIPAASQFWEFNEDRVTQSEADHQRAVQQMIWGLTAVGGVGSFAGIFLGYRVAWSLRRSIRRLSVRIRDAANRLGHDLATITVTEDGDLQSLHEHMKGVIQQIESVVERLQQREREVLRAEQMAAVGQLAAGVAHELRNPLTSINMLVQKNRKQAGAAGLPTDNLQIIEREIRRMERCLQTFLDFARPPKLQRRDTDMASLVEQTIALIEGRARNQQVQLQFDRPVICTSAQVDADQIRQLLVNLTLNALDAMPRGGTLHFEFDPRSNGQVELRAIDTGPGISEAVFPKLFSPFVSGKETGLGLGLVVSRRIAEEHGGTLKGYNRPEGGACFVLRIPTAGQAVEA